MGFDCSLRWCAEKRELGLVLNLPRGLVFVWLSVLSFQPWTTMLPEMCVCVLCVCVCVNLQWSRCIKPAERQNLQKPFPNCLSPLLDFKGSRYAASDTVDKFPALSLAQGLHVPTTCLKSSVAAFSQWPPPAFMCFSHVYHINSNWLQKENKQGQRRIGPGGKTHKHKR